MCFLVPSAFAQTDDAPGHSSFVLHVTPLQTRESYTIRVSTDGLVERWNASAGKVSRVGIAQMLSEVTTPVVELAKSVPETGDLGDGIREGDIYVLATQPAGPIRAFLEPLAPKSLQRLVEDAERLSRAIDMWPAKERFLRGVPVLDEQKEKLGAAGLSTVPWDDLAGETRALYERASASPYEFVSIPTEALDAVVATVAAHESDGRQLYFERDNTTWIQIGLWDPE
jgi:hypothetical protein